MFRNIIWDVDGTLFDTYPAFARCFQSALRDLGVDAPVEWIAGLAKVSLSHCLTTLAERYSLPESAIDAGFDAQYSRVTAKDQPPFPGVADVCRAHVARGGRNYILTHRGPIGTADLLQTHGLAALFSGMITRDDGFPRKPDPTSFLVLLKRFGLDRGETLAVGDRDIDILAGRGAGIAACYFGPPDPSIPADYSIASYDKLEAILGDGGTWIPAAG